MLKQNIKAFTLVELIIVITILAILATIAFTSYQSYISGARDSTRLATLSEMHAGLDTVFAKTGYIPEPENALIFTGVNSVSIKQGDFGDLITRATNMKEIPIDPLTKSKYKYSIFGNGRYYQIVSENEARLSRIISTSFASEKRYALVKGNYKYNPTLPSLLMVPSSITGSGIYGNNVCYIIHGGVNHLGLNNTNCVKKIEIFGSYLDRGLIGYWDMETLSGTMLRDFSGNKNDLLCSQRGVGSPVNIDCATRISSTGAIHKSFIPTQDGVTSSTIARTNGDLGINGNNLINYENGFSTLFITKENPTTLIQSYIYHNNLGLSRDAISQSALLNSNLYSGTFGTPLSFLSNFGYKPQDFNLHTITINSSLRYYLNGHMIYEIPVKRTDSSSNSGALFIGGLTAPTAGMNGFIDEVKIYNRELSGEEIAQQARISGY